MENVDLFFAVADSSGAALLGKKYCIYTHFNAECGCSSSPNTNFSLCYSILSDDSFFGKGFINDIGFTLP